MPLKNFRIKMLSQEIDFIGTKINHFDNLRQKTRQMALILWTATIGFGVKDNGEMLFILAALIPLPFWLIETSYRQYHKGWYGRLKAIGEFIRDGEYKLKGQEPPAFFSDFFSDEYDKKKFDRPRFPILDYWGTETIAEEQHKQETSFRKNFWARKNMLLYLPMFGIGLFLSIFEIIAS